MEREVLARSRLEGSALRIRLAAAALAATILMLAPGPDRVGAASVLTGYAIAAVALRYAGPRDPSRLAGVVGVAIDLLFATALSVLLPFVAGWALYAFALATAALRYGIMGIVATTAAAVIAYDVVLASRGVDARAADLWPVQVLIAFGLVVAELLSVGVRVAAERRWLRAYSLAQRDLAAAPDADSLLARIVDHAVRGFGASAAWIETADRAGARTVRHSRGIAQPAGIDPATAALEARLAPDTVLRAAFADDRQAAEGAAAVRDLAADTAPLVLGALAAARLGRERDVAQRVVAATGRLVLETTVAGALAQVVTTAQELVGPSAIMRRADGTRVVGDLDPEVAARIVRDAPPRGVVGAPAGADAARGATTAAAVPAGPGLALVSLATRREVSEEELRGLVSLGDLAAAVTARIAERDALAASAAGVRVRAAELQRELRDRDDAVASAVHELRNPLTSVQAYGQLMSRNLHAVQRQITQLDSLLEDLLRAPGAPARPLALEAVDLEREATEAAARLRVAVPGSVVRVSADPAAGPVTALVDVVRFAQVLDNVLRNAAKFSAPDAPIDVALRRRSEEVHVVVTDHGDGIVAADLERIFERYTRGSAHETVEGAGIGLAVAREIVAAHRGRIWAESAGPGGGSTFTIALPAASGARESGPPRRGGSTAAR